MFTMLPVMEMLPWFRITCWPTLPASMKETGERSDALRIFSSARLQFVHSPAPFTGVGCLPCIWQQLTIVWTWPGCSWLQGHASTCNTGSVYDELGVHAKSQLYACRCSTSPPASTGMGALPCTWLLGAVILKWRGCSWVQALV